MPYFRKAGTTEFVDEMGNPAQHPDLALSEYGWKLENVPIYQPKGGLSETPGTSGFPTDLNSTLSWMKTNNLLPAGLSTSVNTEEIIRKNLEQSYQAQKGQLEGIYGEKIAEAEEKMKMEGGVAKAQTARFGGGDQGLDTASIGYINSVKDAGEKRIKEIERAKNEAMATLDYKRIDLLNESLRKEEERQEKLQDAMVDRALKFLGIGVDMKQLAMQEDTNTFNIISKLEAGKTYTSPSGVTYTGIEEPEPFFKSSDLISMAKELEIGQTKTIVDPNTGTEFEIQGMKSATESYKSIQSTNERTGEVTITTYDEAGNIVNQVSAGKIAENKPTEAPSSYKEWQLAGGIQGTGKTYAEFLETEGGSDEIKFSDTQLLQLSNAGVPPEYAQGIMELRNQNWDWDAIRTWMEQINDYTGEGSKILDIFLKQTEGWKLGGMGYN
jgi:hypothetical protein